MVALIVIAVVVVFALIFAARTIRVIPQARAGSSSGWGATSACWSRAWPS